MIKVHNAPAGWIASAVDEHNNNEWMEITGKWCPTRDEAIASARAQAKVHREKLIKKIQREEEKVQALKRAVEFIDTYGLVHDLDGT